MNSIEKLTELFTRFPGIGPRQAKRFVYFLLRQNNTFLIELANALKNLKSDSKICKYCYRFYSKKYNADICSLCSDQNRQQDTLMLVSQDADLNNIERIGNYNGLYFVLGGFISVLEKNPEQKIRIKELENLIKNRLKDGTLKEIILAFPLNPDGENTMEYIIERLEEKFGGDNLKISTLGKGLSTGAELEYLDKATFNSAFENRN